MQKYEYLYDFVNLLDLYSYIRQFYFLKTLFEEYFGFILGLSKFVNIKNNTDFFGAKLINYIILY